MLDPVSVSQNPAPLPQSAADAAQPWAAEPDPSPEVTPAKAQAPAVTVEISDSAQAKLLQTEGYKVPEISFKLGIDEETINSYLNVGG
jgi:hypothetical protein